MEIQRFANSFNAGINFYGIDAMVEPAINGVFGDVWDILPSEKENKYEMVISVLSIAIMLKISGLFSRQFKKVENPLLLLQEIRRILKPNGVFAVYEFYKAAHNTEGGSPDIDLKPLVIQAGFDIVSFEEDKNQNKVLLLAVKREW